MRPLNRSEQKRLTQGLIEWYEREKRVLPWRENRLPYEVLVSEIMLQQTQAVTVIDYFLRWMDTFPTLESLAYADETLLLKVWEGLGYYSRARNLQKCAKVILEEHGGIIPEDEEILKSLPGIGPYTAAAITSFAFRKKALALDGNVLRVGARFFGIEEDITKIQTKETIKQKMTTLLSDEKPLESMEALIELGALICNKVPKCSFCPLQESCVAHKAGKANFLPIKKTGPLITYLERNVFIFMKDKEILLKDPPKKGLMSGLYEFPYLDKDFNESHPIKDFIIQGGRLFLHLEPINQGFTRYRLKLFPVIYLVTEKFDFLEHSWASLEQARKLPFSSAYRKILKQISENI